MGDVTQDDPDKDNYKIGYVQQVLHTTFALPRPQQLEE